MRFTTTTYHRRAARTALALMSIAVLMLTISVGTVFAWSAPTLTATCAVDANHYSWQIGLPQEADYNIQFSWSSDFSNPWTQDFGSQGNHAFDTVRGGAILYARWLSDSNVTTSASANGEPCAPECVTLSGAALRDALKEAGSNVADPQSANGSSATDWHATLVVPQGFCDVQVSYSSYSLPGGLLHPFEDQVLFDNVTNTYGPGTYDLVVALPDCRWQVDLYTGDVIAVLNPTYGHPVDRLIDWSANEGPLCKEEPTPTPTPTPTPRTPDLDISKSASVDEIGAGGSYSYKLTVENNGNARAIDVAVWDEVDPSLTVDKVVASQGSCDPVGPDNKVTCDVVDIAPKGSATVTIYVTTDADTCGIVKNFAKAHAENEVDNTRSDQVSVTVNCKENSESPSTSPSSSPSTAPSRTPRTSHSPEESVKAGHGGGLPDTSTGSGTGLPAAWGALLVISSAVFVTARRRGEVRAR